MTLEDFLTLTLPQRIVWLHSKDGPRGRLSHDKFAAILDTSRQTVISWEKGTEPKDYADKLAKFSGFPSWAFLRRAAEAPAAETIALRLQSLADEIDELRGLLLRGFSALAPLLPQSQQRALEVPPSRRQHAQPG